MRVRVRLFAWMAARAGTAEVDLEMKDGDPVGRVREKIEEKFGALRWPAGTMMAVNQEFVEAGQVLVEGDEVAVIPPVSGG